MIRALEYNEVHLEFPSISCNESFARTVVAAFLIPVDPTVEEMADIKTAVSEAVTNCIVHGYPDAVGSIKMLCRLEKHSVTITVEDKGVGIEDIGKARTPMFTTGGAQRSGMGFTIMERFMDTLEVESIPGQGTKVVMRKELSFGVQKD